MVANIAAVAYETWRKSQPDETRHWLELTDGQKSIWWCVVEEVLAESNGETEIDHLKPPQGL